MVALRPVMFPWGCGKLRDSATRPHFFASCSVFRAPAVLHALRLVGPRHPFESILGQLDEHGLDCSNLKIRGSVDHFSAKGRVNDLSAVKLIGKMVIKYSHQMHAVLRKVNIQRGLARI